MKEEYFILLMSVFISVPFAFWQQSIAAGLFMFFTSICLLSAITVFFDKK